MATFTKNRRRAFLTKSRILSLAGVNDPPVPLSTPTTVRCNSWPSYLNPITMKLAGPMSQTLRVLIVDDEASQRAGLAGMVSAWGMIAETASDGLEALEKLNDVPVDVILTDLNMPGMDGFELLARLHESPDSPPAIV